MQSKHSSNELKHSPRPAANPTNGSDWELTLTYALATIGAAATAIIAGMAVWLVLTY